ncbi:MAG TPA: glycosyltransferase [Actinocrinis sp.]|uniref:glycosyltransferase n=1 Tax=Actinocrinis sp. TaxID=1920516 RepID=UPI002DDD7278|nr:glycosyltransferase [Actinocrinis sp.]HEV2343397.1 glycosyltransferase [Actinocrinis sp.]
MSRFLFVSPPLAGHVNPTAGLGRALAERGHEVAWAGSELFLRPLLGPDAQLFPTGSKLLREQAARGHAAIRSLWEQFIVPYAKFTAKAVDKAVLAYQPDVVVSDEHTPAGAFTAYRHGVPWATLATSSMELTRPLRAFPPVEEWMRGHLRTLWNAARLPPDEFTDPRFSPHLVLALTSRALTGPLPFPEHYALVGPVLADRSAQAAAPGREPFPWDRLEPGRRRVLVTMGTLAADVAGGFYPRAVAALGELADEAQGIVIAAPDALPDGVPPNVLRVSWAPILELLERGALDTVVCHGGMNTVCEALAHRVPVVLAPIRHDQPVTAGQVAAAGAGLRVSFERADAAALRGAIETVLGEPSYRDAAGRVSEAFAAGGGARAAADRLEALARTAAGAAGSSSSAPPPTPLSAQSSASPPAHRPAPDTSPSEPGATVDRDQRSA